MTLAQFTPALIAGLLIPSFAVRASFGVFQLPIAEARPLAQPA